MLWSISVEIGTKEEESATEASPARLEGLALEQSQRLRQLSIEDMIGAEKIVQKFIAADGWEAKSAFVRRPEEVIPLMKKWYQTHSAASITGERTDNMRKALVGNTYLVFMEMRLGEDLTSRFFAIEHIPGEKPEDLGTYLVDWETSVGYQPMELSEFRAKQPRDPVIFRVLVKPESYYNYGFEDKEKWVSYRLVYPGENDFEIYGYIPLGSELAAQMEKQLFTEASLVLELKYPETAVSRDQVLITRIVHPAWYKDRSDVRRVPGNHVTPTVAAP